MVRNAMKKGLPRSAAPRVLARRREARCNVVRRFGSKPEASRLPPARRITWSESATRTSPCPDPRRDRVDEWCPVRARSPRASRLAGRDRRRPEGEGAGAAGLQDRPHRRLGVGRARAQGSGAGDLAARPAGARRAGAGALAATPGPPPLELEAARARGAAYPRQALPRL